MATVESLTNELRQLVGSFAQVQTQVGQLTLAHDSIRQLAQTTSADGAALKAKYDNIEQVVRELAQKVDECLKGTKAARDDFTKKQDFKTMKIYSGEPKEFQSWMFQLRMRLTEHDRVYEHVFS